MTIIDSHIRQIKCDAAGCTKEVLYDRKDEQTVFQTAENSWLKTTRVIQTGDGRNFTYCSDSCELEGVKTGKHNLPEAPKIAPAASEADVSAAVTMAKKRAEADAAIRAGQPAQVQLTDK